MFHRPIDATRVRQRTLRADALLAVAVAVLLSLSWGFTDWARLSHMMLPDTDDMMRLAQVRDWLAGQGINDWTQYRVAPPAGAPMHWSRINDVGIAAIIVALTPLVGRHYAEMTAVLLYPGLLFACALFLSARIGRRLWGPSGGPVAAILTALAFPGTLVFIPGRIDHHALQVVLTQVAVLMLMRPPSRASGAFAGLAVALSLIVGLETAPQVVALLGAMFLLWVVRGPRERARMAGFATALGVTTIVFLAFLRPTYWNAALCDAFTPASSTAMLAVAALFAILAVVTPRLGDWRWRLGVGSVLGSGALVATLVAFPACVTGPYGTVDPFLRVNFIANIDEANGIFKMHDWARIVAMAGVPVAALAASCWMFLRGWRRWPVALPVAAVVLSSAVVMLAQARGAYIGAPLGAPVLAGLILAARRKGGALSVVAAWLVSVGPTYAEIPKRIEPLLAGPATTKAAAAAATSSDSLCSVGDVWDQVDRHPSGVVMASTRMASYLVGATHMATVGAGYHRNNAGNMAMYRFFLSRPDGSRDIARRWSTRYVVFCPGDFGEIDVVNAYPDSLAAGLERGKVPPWLERIPLRNTPLRFYRLIP